MKSMKPTKSTKSMKPTKSTKSMQSMQSTKSKNPKSEPKSEQKPEPKPMDVLDVIKAIKTLDLNTFEGLSKEPFYNILNKFFALLKDDLTSEKLDLVRVYINLAFDFGYKIGFRDANLKIFKDLRKI